MNSSSEASGGTPHTWKIDRPRTPQDGTPLKWIGKCSSPDLEWEKLS